eukprot:Opistho-2@15632
MAAEDANDTDLALAAEADFTKEEEAEKSEIIERILNLQSTMEQLTKRVGTVKGENAKLQSENKVLTQYLENLLAQSSLFTNLSGAPPPQRPSRSNSVGAKAQVKR